MNWIKISDGLPEPAMKDSDAAYLTFPHYRVLPWWGGQFWTFDDPSDEWEPVYEVTHWMPLPKAPVS